MMHTYEPTKDLPEIAGYVFKAAEAIAQATSADADGFLRWSEEQWRSIADGGWLDLLVSSLDADADPSEVHDALDALAGFEFHRVPGPLADNIGFAVPLLHQLGASDLLGRMAAGNLVSVTGHDADLSITNGVLRGTANDVHGARHASWMLVITGTPGNRSVLVVDASSDGLRVEAREGLHPVAEADRVNFDAVAVDADQRLVKESGDRIAAIDSALALRSLVISSLAVGGIEALLQRTVSYVQERHQFGVPIGSFQAVKHMVANMKVGVETARSIVHVGAEALMTGRSTRDADVAAARVYSADTYRRASELAMQAHGGFGYTWEQGLHYFYRSALYGASQPTSRANQREIIAASLHL